MDEKSDLWRTLAAHSGVAPVQALLRSGHRRAVIDRMRRSGELIPARRGWVALQTADPLLISAARHNVVVTCVTQAERRGLWVKDAASEPHVGASPHSGHATAGPARIHWSKPVVPRHPHALVDPIENVLVIVARCQPFEAALTIWESALRQGLVDRATLARYPLPPAARELLDAADVYSDSGLETLVVPRLRWLGLPLRRQIWIAGHRVDLLIGERLALQIDGGHHVGAQRDEDIRHDAALRLMGYHVIRVSYTQVVDRWEQVQDLVMRAVAQGLHRARRS